MIVIVTRNVSSRIRGFLSSSLLEVAPGVYTGSRISTAVRERIWQVILGWFFEEEEASIVMVWRNPEVSTGQSVRVLGIPPVELIELDGIVLTKRPEHE